MSRWSVVAALLVLGCRAPDRELLADLTVASAELHDLRTTRVAFIGGVVRGDSDLVIVDEDGVEHVFPVEVRGSVFGLLFDLTGDPGWHGVVELDLTNVEGPVTGDRLLGRYRGQAVSVATGLGIAGRDLRNRDRVGLEHAWFTAGMGTFIGWEWIHFRLPDDDTDGEDTDVVDEG